MLRIVEIKLTDILAEGICFNGAYDKLMNIFRLPFGMTFCCKKADFRISSCPKAKSVYPVGPGQIAFR